MNSLLDDEEDELSHRDREVTLGTGTILAIFLGLVLLCGLFFGFGYKMGSHNTTVPIATATLETPPAPSATFNNFKPAAGSPGGSSSALPHPAPKPALTNDDEPDSPAPLPTAHNAPAPVVRPAADPAPPAATPATGTIIVQVAAFTHQEDADLLVHALKAKGYPAFERSESQDKLLHIQVGPYNNRRDAETTRQRLLADGYQPLIK